MKRYLVFTALAVGLFFPQEAVAQGNPYAITLGVRKVLNNDDRPTTTSISRNDTGYAIVLTDDDATTPSAVHLQLPPAQAGRNFKVVDDDANAAADLALFAYPGDKIDGRDKITSSGDVRGETVIVVAIDDSNWVVISSKGTWTLGDR